MMDDTLEALTSDVMTGSIVGVTFLTPSTRSIRTSAATSPGFQLKFIASGYTERWLKRDTLGCSSP